MFLLIDFRMREKNRGRVGETVRERDRGRWRGGERKVKQMKR